MHFPATAFSKTGEVTLMPEDKRLASIMGQRLGFSRGDAESLGALYGCAHNVKPATRKGHLEALLDRADKRVGPLTMDECICQKDWVAEGMQRCGTAENGWCCNPDNDTIGDWCMTAGVCQGRVWDYCRPPPPREERLAPKTKHGCQCKTSPALPCAKEDNGYCCNADGDPNGSWCHTEGSCLGAGYDYCEPRGAAAAA